MQDVPVVFARERNRAQQFLPPLSARSCPYKHRGGDGKIQVHFTFAVISGANACGEHQPQPKEETL
jgi:hypothetical protein